MYQPTKFSRYVRGKENSEMRPKYHLLGRVSRSTFSSNYFTGSKESIYIVAV